MVITLKKKNWKKHQDYILNRMILKLPKNLDDYMVYSVEQEILQIYEKAMKITVNKFWPINPLKGGI